MARHLHSHSERHASSRIGWLRAAVLGANDGIVSTASLIVGVVGTLSVYRDCSPYNGMERKWTTGMHSTRQLA